MRKSKRNRLCKERRIRRVLRSSTEWLYICGERYDPLNCPFCEVETTYLKGCPPLVKINVIPFKIDSIGEQNAKI